jgi:hypothetical protein
MEPKSGRLTDQPEHYHSRIGYVTPEQMHQGLAAGIIAERKVRWESSRNIVKCTCQHFKQPEAGCGVLKTFLATSSKNRAASHPYKDVKVFEEQ